MITVLLLNYKVNIKKHLFSIIVFILYFLTTFFYYDNYKERCLNYALNSYPKGTAYYLSIFNSMENSNNIDMEVDDYIKLCSKLEKCDGINAVGYELINDSYFIDRKITSTFIYLNEYMQKIQYKLKEGKWFKGDTNEVIIGGKLAKKYRCGDTISVTKEDNLTKKYKIVGILKDEKKIMLLNVSSEEMNFHMLLSSTYENVVLTTDYKFMNDENTFFNREAVVVNADTDMSNKIEKDNNKKNSLLFFDKIRENSLESTKMYFLEDGPMIILMIIYLIFMFIFDMYLIIINNRVELKIYSLFGMSRLERILYIIFPDMFNCVIGLIIVLCYYFRLQY